MYDLDAADFDGDGVMDRKDLCANTPQGVPVDSYRCIRDQDGDGVTDDIDECPNTVSGAAIYINGCERDDDGDNVINHLDECPNTRANAPVDARGCEIRSTVELRGVNFASSSDRLLTGAEQVLEAMIETPGSYVDQPKVEPIYNLAMGVSLKGQKY